MAGKPLAAFIMGPTATGKTDLAIEVAKHLPVEVVSVDSALVYRGMDIGTAKPDGTVLASVPHHLIDIRDPAEPYSAADFLRDAKPLMVEISGRGKIPLLVGGTMLYFRVLLEGLANLPSSDPVVRDEIVAEAEEKGWPYLHGLLAEVDPQAAAAIHPNHSQRIQRALEIYRLTGQPPSRLKARQSAGHGAIAPAGDDFRIVQLALLPRNRALLHRRIAQRFQRMLELGFIGEVEKLHRRADLNPSLPSIRAVGYRQAWAYLEGEIDRHEMVDKAIAATRQLAKRQLTWLRGWPDLNAEYIDNGVDQLRSRDELLRIALKKLQ